MLKGFLKIQFSLNCGLFLVICKWLISNIINLLELLKIIPFELFSKIDKIRECRNKIVHIDKAYKPTPGESSLSLDCTYDLIKINFNLDIKIHLNVMISPITI